MADSQMEPLNVTRNWTKTEPKVRRNPFGVCTGPEPRRVLVQFRVTFRAAAQRIFRNVAQFGSAYRLGRWGHEFESLHSEKIIVNHRKGLLFIDGFTQG